MVEKTDKNKRSKGFSLVEVIIASAVLSIVIGGTASFLGQTGKTKRKDRLRQTQEMLVNRVRNLLNSPSHILFSLSQHSINPSISECLLGIRQTSQNPCEGLKDPQKPTAFGLYQVSGSEGSTGDLVSSPEKGNPVYYDINGKSCKTLKDLCVFQIKTRFYVQCDTSDTYCSKGPKQVFFDFVVTQEIPVLGSGQKLPPLPKSLELRKLTPMTSMDILGSHRFHQCGGKSTTDLTHHGFLVGHDDGGHPLCRCLYPLVKESESKDPLTGQIVPNCRLLRDDETGCQKETTEGLLRGFMSQEDQKDSLCVDRDAAFDCVPMPLGDSCPKDSWITRMASSDCYFVCEFAPDGRPHTCDIEWNALGASGPGPESLNDDHVFPDFICPINELYCCQPAQFEEKH